MASASCKIVAIVHITLDTVYQAPGRSDEDEQRGFSHGGWSQERDDPSMQTAIGQYMNQGWSLLAGRRTFEVLRQSWPILQPDSPMTRALTKVQKYVASHTADPLPDWENTILLTGEAAETVARLKEQLDTPLLMFGSGNLARALLRAGLLDEYFLMVHPIVLGQGLRLFPDGMPPATMRLCSVDRTDTGVIMSRYSCRPDD